MHTIENPNGMERQRILVVDDEESLCEILKFNLEKEGYDVETAYSAEEALCKPLETYDLLILDVMMGQISGFRLARMLKEKEETAHIPIIFCTAKDTEDDTVTGLNLGADDYISKPFSLREVTARVRNVLRRNQARTPQSDTLSFESLVLNIKRKSCQLDGEDINLTKKEFEILSLFLANKGIVFTREEILNKVWKGEVIVLDRTIDVNITRLRRKIGRYGDNIITRNGYGYGFDA